mmetsp:Transcript_43887/g.113947  ORF Transcript_43887/g.113947 Transcript_43887/m.113947 type:complete len:218 (-) Transcript_43887:637-1290(-)
MAACHRCAHAWLACVDATEGTTAPAAEMARTVPVAPRRPSTARLARIEPAIRITERRAITLACAVAQRCRSSGRSCRRRCRRSGNRGCKRSCRLSCTCWRERRRSLPTAAGHSPTHQQPRQLKATSRTSAPTAKAVLTMIVAAHGRHAHVRIWDVHAHDVLRCTAIPEARRFCKGFGVGVVCGRQALSRTARVCLFLGSHVEGACGRHPMAARACHA